MVPSLLNDNRPTTAVIRQHKRTNQIISMSKVTVFLLTIVVFSKMVPIWNTLPNNLKTERHSYQTIKAKMKIFFLEKFKNETNLPEYNKKCWKVFKFH